MESDEPQYSIQRDLRNSRKGILIRRIARQASEPITLNAIPSAQVPTQRQGYRQHPLVEKCAQVRILPSYSGRLRQLVIACD
ncbi:hypothetical protein M378DRAFT_170671 [Amanita muscaria Koide BX008]|uniref:Uncharacterized protein n=1 Tax=Amanita muscaria (strain Koide BX008) TaxID=946122 RepID=A0A0C2WNY8_AMAMK|nr:hypothetical protein M378DRAFT_170671 [Amanita muscaria Koide BX008]